MRRVNEVPNWMKDGFIVRGYRVSEYKGFVHEMFSWHNETINAWTMIASAIVSLSLYLWVIPRTSTLFEKFVFTAFLISCLIHLPFSLMYHLRMHISKEEKLGARKLDITFIFIASIFLTFALGAFVLPIHFTTMLTCLSVYLAVKVIKDYDGHEEDKWYITMMLAKCVAVYLTPVVIATINNLVHPVYAFSIILSLAIGAFVYVYQIPERFAKETFDYVGQSHQIMHLTLLVAHLAEFCFLYKLMTSRV